MTASFAITDAPSPAEEAAIRATLSEANAAAGHPHDVRPLILPLRDAGGTVVGGLLGRTAWSWLYVEALAVPPVLRGSGWGRRLLAAAEEEARVRGCVGARLDTYSFQAQEFYESQGWRTIGAIEGCPPGATRFTMTKRLDGGTPAEAWPDCAAPRAMLTLTGAETDPLAGVLLAGLDRFNTPHSGPHGHTVVNLAVRRPGEAAPCGGLVAHTLYQWLFIRLFYLPEDLRRDGLGAALLRRAEAEARARQCVGVWLDTFSFQARPFYERQGYRVFGTIEDFPPGHARHFLMKRFTSPPRAGEERRRD